MKAVYLTASIIFTVAVLVLAFENIGAQCSNVNFLFFPIQSSCTIIFLGTAVLGIVTGAFYHAFLARVLDTPDEDDQAEQDF